MYVSPRRLKGGNQRPPKLRNLLVLLMRLLVPSSFGAGFAQPFIRKDTEVKRQYRQPFFIDNSFSMDTSQDVPLLGPAKQRAARSASLTHPMTSSKS